MSTDLETLLREAADGPVPAIDLDEVRRRGRRRRRATRAAGLAGVGAVAGVVALGLAVVPGGGTLDPVIDTPVAEGPPAPAAPVDPRFEIVDDTGCTLRFVEGDRVRATASLDGPRGAVLCGTGHTAGDVRAQGMLYAEIGRAPGRTDEDGHRAVGILDGEVAEVELLLDGGERVHTPTHEVVTPGGAPAVGFVVAVPHVAHVRSVSAFDARGAWLFERTPDPYLHAIRWQVDEPPVAQDPVSEAAPIDDLPVELPQDVPPFGRWRPERSPVDLTPLSMRDTGDAWYLAGAGTSGLVDRDTVADRLGTVDDLESACAFLHAQLADAQAELDLDDAEPDVVRETLVHLVLRQEGVLGGDGLTVTLAGACGLSDRTDG